MADPDGLIVAQHVVDGDAGEILRAEHVDGTRADRAAGNGAGAEGLLVVGPVLLAQHAEGLGGAEVGLDEKVLMMEKTCAPESRCSVKPGTLE